MGYNFFNLNGLTFSEINALVAAYNRDVEKKNQDQKKANKRK